jgi:hypothetical protein
MNDVIEALTALARTTQQAISDDSHVATPPVPESMDDIGLPQSYVEQALLKTLYFRGDSVGRDLSTSMGVKFSLLEPAVEFLKRQHLVEVRRSLGIGNMSSHFALSESGRVHAREYLQSDSYVGPIPVPLRQYVAVVRAQRMKGNWLTQEALEKAFSHMVVSRHVLAQLGPAVNAGKSFLIYGQPGNGKTCLAEGLFHIDTQPIFIPYAIEYQGNIVQVYDPIQHQRIDDAPPSMMAVSEDAAYDGRWFRAKRPFIVSGGELNMEMLDLSYNPASHVYDAPFQLKANNGIYLIDDFGRQRVTPTEVLNRWIVPMERRVDYLNFRSGGKMEVPFETFVVFSTNLRPDQLGDEAFLRRIQYKMLVRSPDAGEFATIFRRFCVSKGLPCDEPVLARFIEQRYTATTKPMRRCHPRDVISHAIDLMRFERLPYVLTAEVLAEAFESCFVQDVEQ